MKKIKSFISCALATILVSSCGIAHKVDIVPSTTLDSDNYVYVRDVEAKINYTYFLIFGGLTTKSLNQKLTLAANLMPGEALVNVGVQSRIRTYLGIITTKDIIATGQVVRFTDGKHTTTKSAEAVRTYEKLKNRLSGYEGDFLKSLPFNNATASICEQADIQLGKFGISLNTDDIVNAFNSVNDRYAQKYPKTENNVAIKVIRCDSEGTIFGYIEVTDATGKVVSNIIFEGQGKKSKDPDDMFISSLQNGAATVFKKWENMNKEASKKEKKK